MKRSQKIKVGFLDFHMFKEGDSKKILSYEQEIMLLQIAAYSAGLICRINFLQEIDYHVAHNISNQ